MPRSAKTSAFEDAAEEILDIEGGYSDHESDSGGKTNHGISEALAREYGYTGDMREMHKSVALDIYRRHFWEWMRLSGVYQSAPKTSFELFDAGVNIGRRKVWLWFQRCLNSLNRQEKDYEDIAVDGWPGPNTLNALESLVEKRGEEADDVLVKLIDSLQGHHYLTLVEARPKDEDFMWGWARTRLR